MVSGCVLTVASYLELLQCITFHCVSGNNIIGNVGIVDNKMGNEGYTAIIIDDEDNISNSKKGNHPLT